MRRSRCSTPPPADARRPVPHAHRRRRHQADRRRARPADSPAVSPRSAPSWFRGSTRSRRRSASKTRSTAPTLAVTGEGKLDASSLAGKVVGGVLAWAADLEVPHVAVIAGRRPTMRAPTLDRRAGVQVLVAHRPRVASRARPTRAPRCSWRKRLSRPARSALGTPAIVTIGGRSRTSTGSQRPSVGRAAARRTVRRSASRWRSAVAMTASACGPSSSSGRLRCSRTSEIDLRDRVAAEALDDVDEQSELDAPAFDEGQHFECPATRRVLAAERLHDVGELREEQRQQRARDELGDAAAAGRRAFERSARTCAFTNIDVGVGEQRRAQALDVLAAEVAQVGVEPADDVASARVQRLPHRVALAATRSGRREDRRLGHDAWRPPPRATAAVSSVEPSSMTTISSTEREHGRSRARSGRRWPPRCAPVGTPRSPEGHASRSMGSRQYGNLIASSGQRAHPERLRDRPVDAAATSSMTGRPPSQVPMPDR